MIKKTIIALALFSAVATSPMAADISEAVMAQREGMRALTLLLQLQAEGVQIRHRQALQQSLAELEHLSILLRNAGQTTLAVQVRAYTKRVAKISLDLESGELLIPEIFDATYHQLHLLLDQAHKPLTDVDYANLLMTDYLTMRYAFQSYVGIPGEALLTKDRYYSMPIEELLEALDTEIREVVREEQSNILKARWAMLYSLLADAPENWTRTRSGNPYAPIMVITNATALSDQLATLATD